MASQVGGTISFGGLASGLDTKDIVEKLVKLKEDQLIKPIEQNIEEIELQKETLSPIEEAFETLKNDAKKLKLTDNTAWNVKKATSSDTDNAVIAGVDSNKAIKGTYTISSVTSLAQADRVIFDGVADRTLTQFGTGTISITYKSATTNISISATNNTLLGIVTAINDAEMGVTASIINDGDATNPYRLVLTSDDTGSDTTITHNINSILSLTVDAAASSAAANEAADAVYVLNSISMTSTSNSISDAIPGVSFNLLQTTASATTITVEQDTDTIVDNISTFITSYTTLKDLLKETIQLDPETGQFGPLGQDLTMSMANIRIAGIISKRFNGLAGYEYSSLAEIGIQADVKGVLQVDTSKLTTALESNATDVRMLFQGSDAEDGVAEEMYDYMYSLMNPLGLIPKKKEAMEKQITRLEDLMIDRQEIVDMYQQNLFNKFNRLETTLNRLRGQEAQVASFSSVYSNSANRLL